MEKALSTNSSSLDELGARLALRPESSLCFENAAALVECALALVERQPGEVVMELGEVEMIDSSGLRALLQIRRACEDAGIAFRLGSVSDAADRIIGMSRLNSIFGIPYRGREGVSVQAGSEVELHDHEWKTCEYHAVSDPSIISSLRERATQMAAEAGASGDTLCDIQIAVGEALSNAFKHGSPQKGVSQIHLRCMYCKAAVVFEVQDEGQPFDTRGRPVPNENDMRDHGMGIYLIREAMDVVEFHCDCPGNRVRMIKWLGDRNEGLGI